jgi:hypothetical protein
MSRTISIGVSGPSSYIYMSAVMVEQLEHIISNKRVEENSVLSHMRSYYQV